MADESDEGDIGVIHRIDPGRNRARRLEAEVAIDVIEEEGNTDTPTATRAATGAMRASINLE